MTRQQDEDHLTYEKCGALLRHGLYDRKKLAPNTYLEWVRDADGLTVYQVFYYHTLVLEFYRDGSCRLYNGGWRSATTKARINSFGPEGVRVYQRGGVWYVTSAVDHGTVFFEGIVVKGDLWEMALQRARNADGSLLRQIVGDLALAHGLKPDTHQLILADYLEEKGMAQAVRRADLIRTYFADSSLPSS